MKTHERDAAPEGASLTYTCLNCSARLEGRSCKLRCPRCGYFESCSDLEPHPPLSADRRD
jgi:hypothetical protein